MSESDRSPRGEAPDDRVDLPADAGRPTPAGRREGRFAVPGAILVVIVLIFVVLVSVKACGSSTAQSAPAAGVPGATVRSQPG